jgi:predicted kinase
MAGENRFLGAMGHRTKGFNSMGCQLTLVAGPPGSGKSSYVRQHKKPEDLVWDYDLIVRAITGLPFRERTDEAHKLAWAMRETFIKTSQSLPVNVWIIASAPSMEEREEFRRMGARVIVFETDKETCLKRVNCREYKADWKQIISRWWSRYQPSEKDVKLR